MNWLETAPIDDEKREMLREWLADRPRIIKKLVKRNPPWNTYRVMSGAPYMVTGPGTICRVVSYFEGGDVQVVVKPEDLEPAETRGGLLKTGRGEWCPFPEKPFGAVVNPRWLEVVE